MNLTTAKPFAACHNKCLFYSHKNVEIRLDTFTFETVTSLISYIQYECKAFTCVLQMFSVLSRLLVPSLSLPTNEPVRCP